MLDQIARSWPAKESYFRALDVSAFHEEAGEMHQKKHSKCIFWAILGAIERIMQVNRSEIARHPTKLDMVSDVSNGQ